MSHDSCVRVQKFGKHGVDPQGYYEQHTSGGKYIRGKATNKIINER